MGSQLFLAFKISLREQDNRNFYKSFTFPTTQNKKKQIKTIILDQSSIILMNRFKQYFQISQSKILINIWQHSKDVPQWGNTWKWNIYLKGTNFCTYLILRVEKKIHFCTNFREWSFTKRFEGIIFANLDFIVAAVVVVFVVVVVVVVDDLQPVVVGELSSSWAWSSVWGDSNGKWKCCHSPTFNSIWKAAKGISYRTEERGNDWDFPFSSEIQAAKNQQEKKEVR